MIYEIDLLPRKLFLNKLYVESLIDNKVNKIRKENNEIKYMKLY